MHEFTVGSLFSGIGGFDLGLERAGMRTVWFCEQDEFCRGVLAKHWPGVPCYPDVRALVADADCRVPAAGPREVSDEAGEAQGQRNQRQRGRDSARSGGAAGAGLVNEGEPGVPVPVPYVDVLCGGFPCQDLSLAGKGAGIDGARSGLWGEYARLIRELRPRYVLVENVAALLGRGLGRVLGDLAACGYDAEWDCIPASAVGAPHRRDRLWIVAYPQPQRPAPGRDDTGQPQVTEPVNSGPPVADPDIERRDGAGALHQGREEPSHGGGGTDEGRSLHHAVRGRHGPPQGQVPAGRDGAVDAGWWATEPDVGRVAHGVPNRVDRLAALGNALVPQIAEWLGHRIIETEENRG